MVLYGAETWQMNTNTLKTIQTFVNKSLQKIMGIQWMDKVSKNDLWVRTNQVEIEIDILKRRWGWLSHTLRKPNSNIKSCLDGEPPWQEKKGWQKNTWQ